MNLEMLYLIQRLQNPVLDVLCQGLSLLAEQVPLALIFCIVYWWRDKELGRRLILSLSLSLCANGLLKDVVRAPRPIGQPGIVSDRVGSATGYSFPSNHAQTAASFYGVIAITRRRLWLCVGLGLLVFGIGFSRLYLGLHYPVDVLGGWLLGIMLAFLVFLMRKLPGTRLLLVVLGAVMAVWAVLIGASADTVGAGGLTLGVLLGLLFEERFVRFSETREPRRALARVFGGFVLVGGVYLLFSFLLPKTPGMDACKYGVIAFVTTGGWPWVFTRLESAWIRKPLAD